MPEIPFVPPRDNGLLGVKWLEMGWLPYISGFHKNFTCPQHFKCAWWWIVSSVSCWKYLGTLSLNALPCPQCEHGAEFYILLFGEGCTLNDKHKLMWNAFDLATFSTMLMSMMISWYCCWGQLGVLVRMGYLQGQKIRCGKSPYVLKLVEEAMSRQVNQDALIQSQVSLQGPWVQIVSHSNHNVLWKAWTKLCALHL